VITDNNKEQNTPLVSVLMTSYNREKYIAHAIESVIKSTYKNFELIIVDDGSNDATVSIAKDFQSKDPRIKVYENDINLGDYPNRNKAASYATGKYLKYVDSDDYIYPNGLEIMVNSMEQFPAAGFGLCSLKPDADKPFPFLLNPKESYQYHFFGPGLFHKGPLSAIFLRSAFTAVGGFKENRMISDLDMWHRIALKYPVVLMPDGIVWQRIHEKQELTESDKFIIDGAKIKWKYLSDPACPLTREQIKQIRKMRIKRYSGFVLSGLKHFNFSESAVYLKCLQYTKKIKI
jgi:glycosyltransferase involved in cell wall biosynthesis